MIDASRCYLAIPVLSACNGIWFRVPNAGKYPGMLYVVNYDVMKFLFELFVGAHVLKCMHLHYCSQYLSYLYLDNISQTKFSFPFSHLGLKFQMVLGVLA